MGRIIELSLHPIPEKERSGIKDLPENFTNRISKNIHLASPEEKQEIFETFVNDSYGFVKHNPETNIISLNDGALDNYFRITMDVFLGEIEGIMCELTYDMFADPVEMEVVLSNLKSIYVDNFIHILDKEDENLLPFGIWVREKFMLKQTDTTFYVGSVMKY